MKTKNEKNFYLYINEKLSRQILWLFFYLPSMIYSYLITFAKIKRKEIKIIIIKEKLYKLGYKKIIYKIKLPGANV